MTDPFFIAGDPYPARKNPRHKGAPKAWSQIIVDATKEMDPIRDPCRLDVEFILNTAKINKDQPYGADLDNLLELLFDALGKTVLAEAKRTDSAIVEVHASKRWAQGQEQAGVWLRISTWPWP